MCVYVCTCPLESETTSFVRYFPDRGSENNHFYCCGSHGTACSDPPSWKSAAGSMGDRQAPAASPLSPSRCRCPAKLPKQLLASDRAQQGVSELGHIIMPLWQRRELKCRDVKWRTYSRSMAYRWQSWDLSPVHLVPVATPLQLCGFTQ